MSGYGPFLEDGSLAIRAEDGLEGLDDLALRRVYAGAVEQVRHQVAAVVGRGLLQPGQLALDRRAVTARPHRLHAADLLALEGGIDAKDLDLALLALGVLVDADEDPLVGVVVA